MAGVFCKVSRATGLAWFGRDFYTSRPLVFCSLTGLSRKRGMDRPARFTGKAVRSLHVDPRTESVF
jgi:hypothetical protein